MHYVPILADHAYMFMETYLLISLSFDERAIANILDLIALAPAPAIT